MDDQGQEQPQTLAEVTTLANQAITDLNTLIASNSSDLTGNTSMQNLQTVKNDVAEVENILSAFIEAQSTGV